MVPESSHRAFDGVAGWVAAMFSCVLIGFSGVSSAHTPHDAIDAMDISPNYEEDLSLFIVVQNQLLRSTNRGATWKGLVTGLDSPYLLSDIAISGHYADNDLLFVSTDGDGVYKSVDRGESWRSFNTNLIRLDVGKLHTVGVAENEKILAAGVVGGLFISETAVSDWRRVVSDDVQITSLDEAIIETDVLVIAGDSQGGVWQGGASVDDWQRLFSVDDAGAITSIEIDSTYPAGQHLLIGTSKGGLWSTSDGGQTLKSLSRHWPARTSNCRGDMLNVSLPDRHVRDISSVQMEDGSVELYVSTAARAVYVSSDSGETWELRETGVSCNDQADLDAFGVPHFRELAIGGGQSRDLFVAGFDGFFRSSDSGSHWVQLEALPISLVRGLAVSSADDGNHAVAITTYGGGAYISTDAGSSWSVANYGLASTRLSDIEFSPYFWEDQAIYSASMGRLLSSSDPDVHWVANEIGYNGWRKKVGYGLERRLGFSADLGRRLFLNSAERRPVWPMQIEISPNFPVDETMIIGMRQHGIWTSTDGGNSWDRDWRGPTDWVSALEISPNFAQDNTVFAAFRGAGIYISNDAAETWRAINTEFDDFKSRPVTTPTNYVMDPPLRRALNDIDLTVSPQFAEDNTVFASSASGLYRSSDGGLTWQQLSRGLPVGNRSILALGISPSFSADQSLLASVKGRGLFLSTDGGDSFAQISPQVLARNWDVQVIRFSPTYASDRKVYGATNEMVLESFDGGETWRVVDRPVRYEDWRGGSHGPVRYTGVWDRVSDQGFSGSSQTQSDEVGATATLDFFGSEIVWRGERGPDFGTAKVSIDSVVQESIDLYSPERDLDAEIFRFADLEKKAHRIVIEVGRQKNGQSAGNKVGLDAFDLPNGTWIDTDTGG